LSSSHETKKMLTVRSETAVTNVLGEGSAEGLGLDLGLKLGNQPVVPLRLSMHGVLEALEQLLQVRNSRFKCSQPVRLQLRHVAFRLVTRRAEAADLSDPCDQPLALAERRHRRPGRRGCGIRGT
jgi:hypothetical protein